MDDQHQKTQEKTQARDSDKEQASSRESERSSDRANERQRNNDNASRNMAAKSDDERNGNESGSVVGETMNQASTMVRNVGEQAWSAATNAGGAATDLARQARDQVGGALSGTTGRAGEYISRNVNAYPLAALMIAGAVGYGLGYLFHNSWSAGDNQDSNRGEQNRQKHDNGENERRNHKR